MEQSVQMSFAHLFDIEIVRIAQYLSAAMVVRILVSASVRLIITSTDPFFLSVHAKLLCTDVPPSKVVTILDRYLMLYMQTADKLMRTARWLESFEGGVDVSGCQRDISASLIVTLASAAYHYRG